MENNSLSVPTDVTSQNSVVIDGIRSTTANSFESYPLDLNNQNQALPTFPGLHALQGETVGDDHADLHMPNRVTAYPELREEFTGGPPFSSSSSSLAALFGARGDLQENLNNLAISVPSTFPMEDLTNYASNHYYTNMNYSLASSLNRGFDHEVLGNMNNKWEYEKFQGPPQIGGRTAERTGFQPYSSVGTLDPSGFVTSHSEIMSTKYPYGFSNHRNELSLSLATSQPSVISGKSIPDQCSDISPSGDAGHCWNTTKFASEQTCCCSKELSLSSGSYGPPQLSQVILGSRYLHVIQEILAQIASYSLENLDQMSYSACGIESWANLPFSSSSCSAERGMPDISHVGLPDVDSGLEIQMEPAFQRRVVEERKTQLLTLLQVVDDRYNQCMDEIHTVISAFHAATELDPQVHARFALQTISFLYKNLRDRISNHILKMGAHLEHGSSTDKASLFDNSFVQKQWALQQLKRKDHQLWRPQRGLPERSVSVLRAWMFQNFLHPYPKDAEKHLLAVKSGLTRSQVSNWFINARVRLWKPMIEEMYTEMNKRKARQNDGVETTHRSQMSTINQRFNMN